MFRILTIVLLTILFYSCGGDSATKTKTAPAAPAPQPVQTAKMQPALPSLPVSVVENLYLKCDYIDYVFYNTNFSVSQQERASIQSALTHIGQQTPQGINPNCKAIGRVFYQIDGENAAEADIFFQDECKYFIYYVKGKKTYANMMTEGAATYYQNIFNQVQGTAPQ